MTNVTSRAPITASPPTYRLQLQLTPSSTLTLLRPESRILYIIVSLKYIRAATTLSISVHILSISSREKSSGSVLLAIMKLLSAPAVLLGLLAPVSVSAGTLAARAPAFFDYSQTPIKALDNGSVNGDNPLVYCSDPATNNLKIESVDLTPNPPLAYVLTAHMILYTLFARSIG